MSRFVLYLGQASAAIAAYVLFKQLRATRRIPARKAAAMLQEAWADNHTRA